MLAISSSFFAYSAPAAPALRSAVAPATPVRMAVEDMEGVGPETLNKVFDPLQLSTYGSDKTLAWYRASELKHGRVAMLASVGIAYTCSGGPLFPGPIALDGTTFASLGKDPWAAFDALSYSGKLQMLLVIGLMEFHSEIPSGGQKHYLSGGTPGKIMVGGQPLFDPFGALKKLTPEQKKKKLTSELKNGRLAMIGVSSFFAAHWSSQAVPLLTGKIPMGDPAAPLFGLV
eukprot:Transcript_23054.p1 GENE.Transcript_23054~~Transcript_23054.p1  ORF type:complete len:247 (+),score=89.15 Transcript_23054:52-741(+)